MTDIQRDYEQRYHTLNSRYLAYCYAVDRHSTSSPAERIPGMELPVIWIGSRVDRAKVAVGITHKGLLKPDEDNAVTDKLWQYAVEERA